MSRIKDPSYRLHKQRGLAVVTLPDGLGGRHDVYLGKHGTEASRAEYGRVLTEWKANGHSWRKTATLADMTINELVLAYWQWAQTYYRHVDGSPTNEVRNIKDGLRRLLELYGDSAANAFDGAALETIRHRMIEDGLCRNRINKDIPRIKRMFCWAVPKKLVPLAVYQELLTVKGLRAGRSAAKETDPVKPVARATVSKTIPHLRPPVAAMVQLQLETGMRPGEVIIMRRMDVEMIGKVWTYTPSTHKTAHRGHSREIYIGPRGQQIVRPFLTTSLSAYLFSPRDAMASLRTEQRQKRKSKVSPSQRNRRKRNPKKVPGDRYSTSSYASAITKACITAGVAHWHPNQLRHAKATEIRKAAGLDAARVILGHRSPAVTEVYAELDQAKAVEVMEKLG